MGLGFDAHGLVVHISSYQIKWNTLLDLTNFPMSTRHFKSSQLHRVGASDWMTNLHRGTHILCNASFLASKSIHFNYALMSWEVVGYFRFSILKGFTCCWGIRSSRPLSIWHEHFCKIFSQFSGNFNGWKQGAQQCKILALKEEIPLCII